jgi:hypothetical protein
MDYFDDERKKNFVSNIYDSVNIYEKINIFKRELQTIKILLKKNI